MFQVGGGQRIAIGELLDLLGNLVQGRAQRFDVFALDRGHEAVHQRLADLVRGRAFAQTGQLEGIQGGLAIGVAQHRMQCLGGIGSRDGSLIEQGVELFAGTENGLQREH
ncbi:hypothetical protein D3C78_1277760 [compost metagenome]